MIEARGSCLRITCLAPWRSLPLLHTPVAHRVPLCRLGLTETSRSLKLDHVVPVGTDNQDGFFVNYFDETGEMGVLGKARWWQYRPLCEPSLTDHKHQARQHFSALFARELTEGEVLRRERRLVIHLSYSSLGDGKQQRTILHYTVPNEFCLGMRPQNRRWFNN